MDCYTIEAKHYLRDDMDITFNKAEIRDHNALHNHEFIEIAYISSGKGIQVINNNRINIRKGDLFLLNSNVYHEYTAEKLQPLLIYNCIFKPVSINNYFAECNNFVDVACQYLCHSFYNKENPQSYIRLTGIKAHKLESVFEEMYSEYERKEEGYMQMLRSNLTRLLILMFRAHKNDTAQMQDKSLYKEFIIKETAEYMRRHYKENITCDYLAKRSYLSTNHFHKIFKEITGDTIIHFLQNIRMEEACKLLKRTNLPIERIAEEVGYSDIKYFYGLFRAYNKTTPGKYRT